MKMVKLQAKARISTSKGSFSAGEIFEIAEDIAKRLIKAGYAKKVEPVNVTQTSEGSVEIESEKELGKLKVEELKELAEAIGFDAGDLKKADLIKKIIEEAKKEEAFSGILEMKADEIRAYLSE
jgi:phosphoribosylformylglycinamidine (FGAM) synthase-like amidotransferase family enzyme